MIDDEIPTERLHNVPAAITQIEQTRQSHPNPKINEVARSRGPRSSSQISGTTSKFRSTQRKTTMLKVMDPNVQSVMGSNQRKSQTIVNSDDDNDSAMGGRPLESQSDLTAKNRTVVIRSGNEPVVEMKRRLAR